MQNGTKQKVKGKAQQVTGQIQELFGELTNNPEHVSQGRRSQAVGTVKENVGEAREIIDNSFNEVSSFVQTEAKKPRTRWATTFFLTFVAVAVIAYFLNQDS